MMNYKDLLTRHDALENEMREAIVELLKAHGENGRVVYRPEGFEEGDDITDYDGDFPVTATLWGNHFNPDVNITDIFLGENGHTVYACGIDTRVGCMSDEPFEIYSSHYYDALSFILIVLKQQGIEL
jgi:hypothetical protein